MAARIPLGGKIAREGADRSEAHERVTSAGIAGRVSLWKDQRAVRHSQQQKQSETPSDQSKRRNMMTPQPDAISWPARLWAQARFSAQPPLAPPSRFRSPAGRPASAALILSRETCPGKLKIRISLIRRRPLRELRLIQC